ncbi:MAG: beta-L-arabinofuranosidase domain-containing protein [Thermoguttaceae bacterium]
MTGTRLSRPTMLTLAAIGLCACPAAGQATPKVPLKAVPFSLQQVRLLDSPFRHAMQMDLKYLLSLDADRLLHNFRANAGLPSSARPLGGWEEPRCELRGHFVGHYLSACAMMYASTGDQRLKQKADYIVAELAACQAKIGTGYLSAFPEEFIDRVEAGQRVWAPWYTIHKIYAGLLDMYLLCGNAQALEVLKRGCDWVQARTDRLSDHQMQKMLGNEHGGMNEVLAELYAVTGEEKYLRLSRRFNHRAVLDPLARREDRLTGLHANTQFPKVLGAARQYELTGDPALRTAATFFWEVVTRERSYVTGGNSDGEVFSPKEELSRHLGPSTTESCNTYNMLKITRRLFGWDPKAEYADYYERALYNHILASQNPETGMMCYYVPLKTGSAKQFSSPEDSFWCCVGTGVENHAKYGESIYFHDGHRGLYVNLFLPSELTWDDCGLTVRQETRYPESDRTRLVFTCREPVELTLHIRHPYWAVSGIAITLDGQKQAVQSRPGSYASLTRVWNNGQTVEVRLPMSLRTEGFRDNPRKLAILYGPLVLCAEVAPGRPEPAIVAEISQIPSSIRPIQGEALAFAASPRVFRIPGASGDRPVKLIPFYRQYQKPYVVYWDVLDEAQWKARLDQYEAELARQEALQARTVDRVLIGEEASEREHRLAGENTSAGPFGGQQWRHAVGGGWFSYQMKLPADKPAALLCTYWGSDSGPRRFDILIDGVKIATQKLQRNRPNRFYDELYPIPPELSKGKHQITVRFQAHPGMIAGGLFDCRILSGQAEQ